MCTTAESSKPPWSGELVPGLVDTILDSHGIKSDEQTLNGMSFTYCQATYTLILVPLGTKTLPPWTLQTSSIIMFLALILAAACLYLHQVQLGLGGGLSEMLGWPTGVGEERFFSCMVLSNGL